MAIGKRYPLLTYLKVEKESADKVRSIMLRASKDLERDIAALAGKPGLGANVSRLQLESQRAAIKAHLGQDFTQVGSVVANGQQMAAKAASEVVSRYEETLTGMIADPKARELIRKSEALRAASSLETVMARQQSSYIPLKKQVYQTGKVARGMVDKAVDSALARGLTWKEFSKEVRGLVDPATPGGVSYAADRLARTEINNAFHASAAERFANSNLVIGVDWNLSSSHPEGDECDDFASASPHETNSVPQKPHPFCLCFLTPALPDEDEFFKKLMDGDYDDEPAAESQLTTEGILKGTKAAERQRLAMEKGMFKKGKVNTDNGWTHEVRRSWQSYTEAGGRNINQMLRNPKAFAETRLGSDEYFAELLAKQADDLKALINKNALTDDVVVARGVSIADDFNPALMKPGDTFADPAFLSTTTNLKDAADFASGRGAGTEGWTFITKAPKGTNAINGADYQSEIIFGPGQTQKVLRVDPKTRTVYTEMTPDVKSVPKLPVTDDLKVKPAALTEKTVSAWTKENLKDASKLPAAVQSSLTEYAGHAFSNINSVLRRGRTGAEATAQHIKNIDKAMEASLIKSPVTVKRTTNLDSFTGSDDLMSFRGKTIKDDGYTSTSLTSFFDNAMDADMIEMLREDGIDVARATSQVFMEINVPAGAKGVWLEKLTGMQGEDELLLPRGSQFRINSITDQGGGKWKILADLLL